MKTVINKTSTPLKLPLPGGKTLHLGPRQAGQIRDEAAERPGIKKLVDAGKIEIAHQDEHERNAGWQGSAHHETTHAQRKASFRQKTGDR
jgi:hypothetical protein